jgi:predicted RNA-binding Zn ribbon-like protein
MQSRHWGRVGGDVVLDLVDTVSWQLDDERRVDRISRTDLLIEWAAERGVISPSTAAGIEAGVSRDPEAAGHALAQVHALRAVVSRILEAQVAGQPPAAEEVERVRIRWQHALASADVSPGLPLTWSITPRTAPELVDLLALCCGDFLRTDHPGLRRCEGPGCGWFFLDTSRNHSRRWCDPQDCGNRVRVTRHARATTARVSSGRRRPGTEPGSPAG